MHLKKKSKLVNFCVAILTLKMEENTQHFLHSMLYYFKKGKNATDAHKKMYREGPVTYEHVKSGL